MTAPSFAPSRSTAMGSVWWFSVKRGLSVKARARTKVLPLLALAVAFVPAIACVGIGPMLRRADGTGVLDGERLRQVLTGARLVPSPAEYLTIIPAVIALFAALVVPELVSGDRADGLRALYDRSILGRGRLWVARAAAIGALLMAVVTGPLLVLLAGTALVGDGSAPPATLAVTARAFVAGAVVAATYGAAATAVSAATARRDVAAAGVVGVLVVPPLAARALVRIGGPSWVRYGDLGGVPLEWAQRLLGAPGAHPELASAGLAAVCAAVVAIAAVVVAVADR